MVVMSNPLIITGIAGSGTSILTQVINTHPEFNVTNERLVIFRMVQFLEKLMVVYPNVIPECWTFNEDVEQFLKSRGCIARYLRKAVEELYDTPKYKYYGDKFPVYLFCLEYINMMFPDAKYLITYRTDHERCVKSIMHRFWAARMGKTIENMRDEVERGHIIIDKVKNDSNKFIIEFDDLVSNTQETFNKISTFLEVENLFDTSSIKVNGV
jgi:hypothetical protein